MMRTLLTVACSLVLISAVGSAQGKFSGYMFGDYSYNVSRDTGFATSMKNVASPSGNTAYQEFKFRRIYFTYDDEISPTFSSRFRLEADQSSNTTDGKIGVAVKDAYLKWKDVFKGSDLYFGIQPTPAYEFSEALWGYRSLEKTVADLRGLVSSRDLGVGLRGKITDDGMFGYWLLIGNNAGGNKPETNKYKRFYGNLQVKPMPNLLVTVHADFADAADIKNTYDTTKVDMVSNGTLTYNVFVGYSEKEKYAFGIEYYNAANSHGFDDGTQLKTKNTLGFSVFGSVYVLPELVAIARYDSYDPNTDGNVKAKYDSRGYILAGLDWKVDKRVSIMPNFIYETYEKLASGLQPVDSKTLRLTFFYTFL